MAACQSNFLPSPLFFFFLNVYVDAVVSHNDCKELLKMQKINISDFHLHFVKHLPQVLCFSICSMNLVHESPCAQAFGNAGVRQENLINE